MRRIVPWLVAAVSMLIAGVVSFWVFEERSAADQDLQISQQARELRQSPAGPGEEVLQRQLEELSRAHRQEIEQLREAHRQRRLSDPSSASASAAAPTPVGQQPGASSISIQSAPLRTAESLQAGKIAWNTPPTMTLGQTAEVELRITLEAKRFKGLEQRIRAPGATTSEEAELAPDLTAKLESIAFDIKPDGAQRQRARDGRDAVWSWVISPKLKGDHKLLLTITSNAENSPSIQPLVRTIQVTAAPGEALDEAIAFVSRNWDKLLTLLIIPIAAWGWQTFKKRRTQSQPPLPPTPPGE